MKNSTLYSILCLLCVLSFFEIKASDYEVFFFNKKDKLHNELIKGSTHDGIGRIWMATDEGLSYFNGMDFTHVELNKQVTYTKDVIYIGNHQLLAAADDGIYKISYNDELKVELLFKSGKKFQDEKLWYPKRFYKSKDGSIWLSDNVNVFKYVDDQTLELHAFDFENKTESFQRSYSFLEFGTNFIAISERGNIFKKNGNKFEAIAKIPDNHSVASAIALDEFRGLIATNGGVYEMTYDNEFPILRKKINHADISDFAFLKNKLYASSWNNGMYELHASQEDIIVQKINDFKNNTVNALISDEDQIWACTDNGLGILVPKIFNNFGGKAIGGITFDQTKAYFITENQIYQTLPLGSDYQVSLIFMPEENQFINYIKAYKGKLYVLLNQTEILTLNLHDFSINNRIDLKDLAIANLNAFEIDDFGKIWMVDEQSNINIYAQDGEMEFIPAEAFDNKTVTTIYKQENYLFLGLSSNVFEVARIDVRTKAVERLVFENTIQNHIDFRIEDIAIRGEKAFMASNFGLFEVQGHKLVQAYLPKANVQNSIKSVMLDKNENLWFADSEGLHFKDKDGQIFAFDENNGLGSKTSVQRMIAITNGMVFFGTEGGLSIGHLEDLAPRKTPRPIISDIVIDNKIYHYADVHNETIEHADKPYLKIDFNSIVFPQSAVSYFYRLNGEAWKETKEPSVTIPKLSFGNQIFEFKAHRSGNYIESKTKKITFKMKQPWFLTALAKNLGLLLVGLIVFGLWKWRSYRLKMNNKRLEAQVIERTKELREQNQILNIAKRKAEEASRAKALFLSTMSHEIRTPMNAVIGMTNLLLQNEPRTDQVENLETLKFSGKNLLGIINDILDFNKIEAGKLTLEKTVFDFRKLLHNVHRSLVEKAKVSNLYFKLEIDEKIPQYVVGDPTRLSQVFINLINNAIKFTEEGGVKIQVQHLGEKNGFSDIKCCVIDTGIGIAKDKHDSIFQSFEQADADTTRKYGGTGLGLAITKKLVELHDSTIVLDSELGKGTCFSFEINLEIAEATDRATIANEDKTLFEPFDGERILLVEDNKINILIARKFLTKWNLTIDVAENGQEAVDKYSENTYPLILMDLQMPIMDGVTATKHIREMEMSQNMSYTPIIALTASAMSDVRDSVLELGMDDFMCKPFEPADLYNKIKHYISETIAYKEAG